MRIVITFLCSILMFQQAFPQKQYNVLDWKSDVTLNTWLVQRMQLQYKSRSRNIESVSKSKQLAEGYIKELQNRISNIFRLPIQKSPLKAKVTGAIQKDGYSIEKIIYESFPNHHVTANLYVPEGKGKFPAAIFLCGHEDAAKATPSYQKTAILFAKNGFVVLVVDPVSQGERMQLTDKAGKALIRGGTTEHTLLNETSNLPGTSLPAYELQDNIRSLDYLITRPEVDTARIGCLGNSGGAIQTIYLAGVEKRLKAFAVCSYLATRERTLELSGAADGCAQIPGEGALELEMNDYLIAAAPKPILVLAGRYDFIDYKGTEEAFEELRKIYTVLGTSDKVHMMTYDDGHGISKPKRESAITFFRKWLANDPERIPEENWLHGDPNWIHEKDVETLTVAELQVTKTGQVNTEYSDEVNLHAFNLSGFEKLKFEREIFSKQSDSIQRGGIWQLFKMGLPDPARVHVEEKEQVEKNGVTFQKKIVRREREVPVPVLVHNASSPKKIIVWLHDQGKQIIADSTNLMKLYDSEGSTVVLADLRGVGETKDKAEENDPKYYNNEYRNAMLALHIGKPLMGQRITDIFSIIDMLSLDKSTAHLPIEIHATGHLGLAAMLASYVQRSLPLVTRRSIQSVHLYHTIHSFKEILENPTAKNWYSYVIPNILKYLDIPDIEKLVGQENIHRHD